MNAKNKVLSLALCMGCLALGISHAADATKVMSLDDCTAVLEKLKTDKVIKKYDLHAGERGMMRLDLGGSEIADLTPIKGMPLSDLVLSGTKATDLSPLLGCPDLEKLVIPEGCTDLEPLRKLKKLKFISDHFDWWGTKAEDFWKAHDNPGWPKMKKVLDKLQADGTIKQYKLDPGENGLLKLDLSGSGIVDLTPLKGMPIEWLHVDGGDQDPSRVVSLAGLEGMPLKELSLSGNVALEDIGAIKDAPLKVFKIGGTHSGGPKVKDISVLKGMKLTALALGAPVEDLNPLEGMPLESVFLGTAAKDVSVLKGMPLKSVHLAGAVTDIGVLKGMQLKSLSLHGANSLVDLSPLKGMPLEFIDLYGVKATDLSSLKGMPLTMGWPPLWIPPGVTDLSFLEGMPLPSIELNAKKIADLTPLRKLATLKTINGQPAAEFWKKFDEGKK